MFILVCVFICVWWFSGKPLSKTKSDIYKLGSILDNSVFVSMVNMSRSFKLNLYHMALGYTPYIL